MRRANSGQPSAVSFMLLIGCMFAGCLPVQKPPQLTFTPGAPFVVTHETFDAGTFRVSYPAGWRVITGQASAPTTVIFVAPGDSALIMLSLSPIDAPPILETGVEMRSETRTMALGDVEIEVYGTAPASEWESFSQRFEALFASITG